MSGSRALLRRRSEGQALVFLVIAMIPALIMVALIVDGGNAWANQRVAQNGADSAADGGATVLAQRVSASGLHTSPEWDALVDAAVDSNAAANNVVVSTAYYTDICGTLLTPAGTMATGFGDAAVVGSGGLPASAGTSAPTCDVLPITTVGPVAGVRVLDDRDFGTFIAGVVGLNTWTASADATAVAGYLQGGLMLPIAFNVSLVYCDQQGDAVDTGTAYNKFQRLVLPICKHGPGNVGWLDWEAPNGGTDELVGCVETPCDFSITPPEWLKIAQAGGTSSKPLEDAINDHAGDVVLLPQFSGTCTSDPDDTKVNDSTQNFGCSSGFNSMDGTQSWYRVKQVGAFLLEHAYINGNNKAECNPDWSDPPSDDAKSTDCLIGQWVDFIDTGTVGPDWVGSFGATGAVGVQLIK